MRKCLHKTNLLDSMLFIFLINDRCGRAQLTMRIATHWQVVFGCMRKQTEQAM